VSAPQTLGSKWVGINPSLLAAFYRCEKDGSRIFSEPAVMAPLPEFSIGVSSSWESVFDNARRSVTTGLLQVGAGIVGVSPNMSGYDEGSFVGRMAAEVSKSVTSFENKNGMTKLNAAKVFMGTEPVRFRVKVAFKAYENGYEEVEVPADKLISWCLPEEIFVNSLMVGAMNADGILPSKNPPLVALEYRGRLYAPLVITSVERDEAKCNMDSSGYATQMELDIELVSWTVMDAKDWGRSGSGQPIITS